MKARCYNKAAINYGGKGIKVCDRWMKFENFLEDMGERPRGLTIERIDSTKNYEPGNCRWATYGEQANNKSNNRLVTYKGKTLTAAQWARELGLRPKTVQQRLRRGWSMERIFRPV